MKHFLRTNIHKIFLAVICVLIALLLTYLWFTPNLEVSQTRTGSTYTVVQNVTYTETQDKSGSLVRQFRFTLDEEVSHDTTLAFFFSHQNATVFLDGEKVYSLQTSPKIAMIRTPGCNWAMIPLYREDVGKEVLVELTPVYANYQEQNIEFCIGSKYAISSAQLIQSLPEMLLSFLNLLAGCLLLVAAIYFSCKRMKNQGLYTLALLAISPGLWNFTQTRFAPILFEGKSVYLYYVSLTMLMFSVLPLLQSVQFSSETVREMHGTDPLGSASAPALSKKKPLLRHILQMLCLIAVLLDILQLLFQWAGLLDLRQTLTLTHCMLIIGSVFLIFSSIAEQYQAFRSNTRRPHNCIWLLGIGILSDLVLYYFNGRSNGLPMTLFTMFLYVLSEGVHLFTGYIRQQHMLEEKENQLTMSRVTTMMSQIRSHFVFNVLNAISGMCKYDPEKADETVVRFARYLRNNIDIMEDDHSIPFTMELERLEDYVILEQVRFGERIQFETNIETADFLLPPLILQPVIENAIKHGLNPKEEGGTITLRTQTVADRVVITVSDDGVGFDPALPNREGSIGLKNIRFRLQHLVGGTLHIDSVPDRGTTVTITIPKEKQT